ncbi:MAG: FeoB-associated Cys-rich membrane protein [Clostridia bacterium]|nr:FeoB-associated Cys-rich membrane protein [Clostridia bacterium]
MLAWIAQYWATVLICLGLLAMVFFLVRSLIKDHKNGKSSCGCGCSGCAMASKCHETKK